MYDGGGWTNDDAMLGITLIININKHSPLRALYIIPGGISNDVPKIILNAEHWEGINVSSCPRCKCRSLESIVVHSSPSS
jgi:hypothetical protein